MTRVALGLAAAVALAGSLLVGTVAARPDAQLTVYAASSLTDAFPAIDQAERYSFGGSNALATQIRNGAPADVFASANTSLPRKLYAQGLVEKPVVFTRNALVLVVPKANPAHVRSVHDLTKPGVTVDVANDAVPVGSYTLQVLRNLKLATQVLRHVVSQETDVRTVLAKVALGQADAGFVYSTDARAAAGEVRVIRLPGRAQPNVAYALAVVKQSPHQAAAKAFVHRVLSKAGQAQLLQRGFLPLVPQK